ncbi:unnamed protein product [Nippostrongylus brasiliensis]|uniref:YTH domain-containing protein n=1 Tax=Nippostrongylus brasiliensis TaxID=27835 RepID=A0A0N4XIX4_NIPBR|nr:unnamed protein product [Nippostrongylus brasiliensis]
MLLILGRLASVARLDENSVTAAARDRGNDDDREEANAAASVNGRNEGHRRRRRTSPLRHTKGGASADDDSHDRSSTTTRPYSTRDDICQKIACRGYPTVADSRLKPSADVGGMNHSTTASRPAATSHQPQQVIYFFAMRAPLHLVNERNLGSDFLSAPDIYDHAIKQKTRHMNRAADDHHTEKPQHGRSFIFLIRNLTTIAVVYSFSEEPVLSK